jgi:hypothetical protein
MRGTTAKVSDEPARAGGVGIETRGRHIMLPRTRYEQ